MLNFRLNSMEDLKLEDDEAAAPTSFGVGPLLSFLSNRELGTLGRLQVNRFLNPFCFACPLPWGAFTYDVRFLGHFFCI